uniref:NB-ARC domain-containing protein n=1 Tax=Salix viminalis TaxID=40686 RepID=A0A6N2KU07_SALVM
MLKHIYNELLQSSNISHHVYWVTVSRDFSIHKLGVRAQSCKITTFSTSGRIARDIKKQYASLLLGIKTIVGTMKGVDDMHEWSDALEDLIQSRVTLDKMEDELSDFAIPRQNLIEYLIDEGVVKWQKSREVEINKGHIMVDRLEKDMAIQILEENSQAIVIVVAQLRELSDAKELSEKLTSVSLMHNQIEEICSGHSPRSPNLSNLLLSDHYRLLLEFKPSTIIAHAQDIEEIIDDGMETEIYALVTVEGKEVDA